MTKILTPPPPPSWTSRANCYRPITLTPHSAGPTCDNWTKAYRNRFDNIQRRAGRAAAALGGP